jgi:hypothetical protein
LEEFEDLQDEDTSAALAFAAGVLRGEQSPMIAAE